MGSPSTGHLQHTNIVALLNYFLNTLISSSQKCMIGLAKISFMEIFDILDVLKQNCPNVLCKVANPLKVFPLDPYHIWSNTAILFNILLASSAVIVPALLGHSALFQKPQIQHVILQPPHHQEQDRTACDHHHLRSTPSWTGEDDFCSPQKTVFPMLIWFCLSGPSASSYT